MLNVQFVECASEKPRCMPNYAAFSFLWINIFLAEYSNKIIAQNN